MNDKKRSIYTFAGHEYIVDRYRRGRAFLVTRMSRTIRITHRIYYANYLYNYDAHRTYESESALAPGTLAPCTIKKETGATSNLYPSDLNAYFRDKIIERLRAPLRILLRL